MKLHGYLLRQAASTSDDALLWAQASEVCAVLGEYVCGEHDALRDLAERCDGADGIRADGSNIDTLRAHASLGELEAQPTA